MPATNDVIRGALKLDSLLEGQCFKNWQDFLKAIPSMFSIEIPTTITNVVNSNQQPGDDERDALWIRRDNAGNFLGMFIYAIGMWRQIYPAPNAIMKMYGNSTQVPDGYVLADEFNPHITAAEAAILKAGWVLDSTATYYTIFEVTYEGF